MRYGTGDLVAWLTARGFAAGTCRIYGACMGKFVVWCDGRGLDPMTVTRGTVYEYLDGLGVGEASKRQVRAALTHFWAMANRADPPRLSVIKHPKAPPRPRPEWSVIEETRRLGEYLERRGFSTATVVWYVRLFEDAAEWCAATGLDVAAVGRVDVAAMSEAVPATRRARTALRYALGHYWRSRARKNPPLDAVPIPDAQPRAAAIRRGLAPDPAFAGEPTPGQDRQLAELAAYLITEGLAESTIRNYANAMRRVFVWCNAQSLEAADLDGPQVASLASMFPKSTSMRRQLRMALTYFWRMEGRHRPPVRAVRVPPKPRGVCRALDETDATLLAKTATDWYPQGTAVLLGLYLALRRTEIATARWDRFDDDLTRYTVHGKLDIVATLPVHPKLRSELESRRPSTRGGYLFPGPRGRDHIAPTTVWLWTRVVAELAGIGRITTHQLRHTAIATANDNTQDLRTVQAFARHANPEETARYTRATWRRLEEVTGSLDYT